MNQPIRAGILGAGLGSRLKKISSAKPMAMLEGQTLLSRLIYSIRACGIVEVHCALRGELFSNEDREALPEADHLYFHFVNTESSLHTLVELIGKMGSQAGPVLFSMADTVLRPSDLKAFQNFCSGLAARECAVLVTTFVDDEKPLWAHLDEGGSVKRFSSEPASHVTSGIYFLTPQAMEIAEEILAGGTHKMRNFLGALAERGIPIKSFVVTKTIDVDHPSDLEKAADFLRSN